eukprot:TRINITY_DN56767_c0_g1_i1.p1 TRINITY_DN56767_c0_g1~~TRINITY_DN56767_c0_g1_i1.p1  ORF type:complete len:746 (+),score=169.15 TRINITY_DN56767_c0_g1_i1:66-2240(+)
MVDGDGDAGWQELGPSWCSYRSILDVFEGKQPRGRRVPFKPPVARYLRETTFGVRHSGGDVQKQQDFGRETKITPARRAELLVSVLCGSGVGASAGDGGGGGGGVGSATGGGATGGVTSSAGGGASASAAGDCGGSVAERAAFSLFWIVLGGVFGRVPATVVDSFRDELAHSWHKLHLAFLGAIPRDIEAREWALAAVPLIFGQAFYRIIVDAFVEDRKHFVMNATVSIDKITRVCHFELTGFQITSDTLRRERRKLFTKSVLLTPHMNQEELLRGKKRQEMLECRSTSAPQLAFGELENGVPLEEITLDHLLQVRAAAASRPTPTGDEYDFFPGPGSKAMAAIAVAAAPPVAGGTKVPTGDCDACAFDIPRRKRYHPPEGLSVDNYLELSTEGSALLDRHMMDMELLATESANVNHASSATDLEGLEEHDDTPTPSPSSTARASQFSGAPLSAERRERDLKARRMKHEALHKSVAVDPLPPELCEREVLTTWVSPVVKRLVPSEKDRCMLRKTASESFNLKMAHKPFPMVPLPTKSSSLSSLGRSTKCAGLALTGGSGASAAESAVAVGGGGGAASATSAGGVGNTSGVGLVSPNPPLSMSQKMNAQQLGSSSPGLVVGGEPLVLGQRGNLSNRVIMQRFDTQLAAFRKGTFVEYMEEYDVLTGALKTRLDKNRLRKEEAKIVQKMEALLGGPPVKFCLPGVGLSGSGPSVGGGRAPATASQQ